MTRIGAVSAGEGKVWGVSFPERVWRAVASQFSRFAAWIRSWFSSSVPHVDLGPRITVLEGAVKELEEASGAPVNEAPTGSDPERLEALTGRIKALKNLPHVVATRPGLPVPLPPSPAVSGSERQDPGDRLGPFRSLTPPAPAYSAGSASRPSEEEPVLLEEEPPVASDFRGQTRSSLETPVVIQKSGRQGPDDRLGPLGSLSPPAPAHSAGGGSPRGGAPRGTLAALARTRSWMAAPPLSGARRESASRPSEGEPVLLEGETPGAIDFRGETRSSLEIPVVIQKSETGLKISFPNYLSGRAENTVSGGFRSQTKAVKDKCFSLYKEGKGQFVIKAADDPTCELWWFSKEPLKTAGYVSAAARR